jgi:hypothetical protein
MYPGTHHDYHYRRPRLKVCSAKEANHNQQLLDYVNFVSGQFNLVVYDVNCFYAKINYVSVVNTSQSCVVLSAFLFALLSS